MKTQTRKMSSRTLAGSMVAASLLLLAGCLYKHVVWSPDGNRAAVISGDNLYLCDTNGRLSSLLVSNVSTVAWLNDSQRLVLWRVRNVKDWSAISKMLGQERAETMTKEAESIWQRFRSGTPWSEATINLGDKTDVLKICLRDRHNSELHAKLSEGDWKDLESKTVQVNDLVIARVDGDKIEVGATLHGNLGRFWDMRPSPQGAVIAFTVEMKPESDNLRLLVVPADGSSPATAVASNTAAYPDWTADGRALVYFQNSLPQGDDDVPRLAVLTRRSVLDEAGRVKLEEKPQYLAGGMFNGMARVRCLRDGRIFFNAAELSLPISAGDYGGQHEQLFALDLSRQATLVRVIPRQHESDLPESLTFFEVSPDEQQVLFGGDKMPVSLLTLSNGQITVVQPASKENDMQGLPVWRKDGEFTYMKRIEPKDGKPAPRKAEVVLRRGDQETVLSQSWPNDIVEHVVK